MHEIWLVDSKENIYNCCHHMSSFKAKMHQIRFFGWGSAPDPAGELTALPQIP